MRCKICDKIIELNSLDPKLELCNTDFKNTRDDLIELLGDKAYEYDIYGDLSKIEKPNLNFHNYTESEYTAKEKTHLKSK